MNDALKIPRDDSKYLYPGRTPFTAPLPASFPFFFLPALQLVVLVELSGWKLEDNSMRWWSRTLKVAGGSIYCEYALRVLAHRPLKEGAASAKNLGNKRGFFLKPGWQA